MTNVTPETFSELGALSTGRTKQVPQTQIADHVSDFSGKAGGAVGIALLEVNDQKGFIVPFIRPDAFANFPGLNHAAHRHVRHQSAASNKRDYGATLNMNGPKH